MRLRDYYQKLDRQQREAYAKRAGTSTEYIRIHLIKPNGNEPDRIPGRPLIDALADASAGEVSRLEVLEHFYGELAA